MARILPRMVRLCAAGAVLLLAACSSSGAAPSPSAPSPSTAVGRFFAVVDTLKYQQSLFAYSHAELLREGRYVCRTFDGLRTDDDRSAAWGTMARVGWDPVVSIALVKAAARTLC